MRELQELYFDWMYKKVINHGSYVRLLKCLDSIEFTYTLPMDDNRYEDAVSLRYRFGYENGIDDRIISYELDDHACSVLEMMVALALRIEESIMRDEDVGDRTYIWFMVMLNNLGVDDETDDGFNRVRVTMAVIHMLDRDYDSYGNGALFKVEHPRHDMRDTEIWYQAMWWLTEHRREIE